MRITITDVGDLGEGVSRRIIAFVCTGIGSLPMNSVSSLRARFTLVFLPCVAASSGAS